MLIRQIISISVLMITSGIFLWGRGRRLLSKRILVSAKVIDNKKEDSDGSDIFYPVIQFSTVKQEVVTKELGVGFYPAMRVGKELSVVYLPDNPDDIMIWPWMRFKILPAVLVAIGLAGLIVAILDYCNILPIMPD